MIYLYYQIDHNFRNLTKFVSQFLDTYTNLYQLYKSSSEIEIKKLLLIPKKKKRRIISIIQTYARPAQTRPTREMAHEG